jgi:hypothetical protein
VLQLAYGARHTSVRHALVLLAAGVLLFAKTFPFAEVAILGDIDYGKKSDALACPVQSQKFCALLFNGASGDEVEVTVTGGEGKAFVAIADGALNELASGSGSATMKLPAVADGLATYYIVFQGAGEKAGRFTVDLKKVK